MIGTCLSMLIAFVIASARWFTLQQLVVSGSKVVQPSSRRKRRIDQRKEWPIALLPNTHTQTQTCIQTASKHTIAPTAILLHVQYGHLLASRSAPPPPPPLPNTKDQSLLCRITIDAKAAKSAGTANSTHSQTIQLNTDFTWADFTVPAYSALAPAAAAAAAAVTARYSCSWLSTCLSSTSSFSLDSIV